MLLTHCYPGRVVTYRRGRRTFTARILYTTPLGNVRVRLFRCDGRTMRPLVVCLRPERIDSPANGTQAVEQTAHTLFSGSNE